MKNEKIAAVVLVVIIAGALTVYLAATYGDHIFKNIFGEEKIIELGDCVDVHYVGRFAANNSVFDSSYEDIENKTGGTPLNVFVNPNMNLTRPTGYENYSSSVIRGFQNGLVGMKPGENKSLIIPPEDAYGDWNETALEELFITYYGAPYYPRYIEYNFTEIVLKDYFPFLYAPDADITNLSVGQTFTFINGTSQTGENASWQVKITNISDENLTILHIVENGTIINKGLWNSTIIVDNETNFRERADPEVDSTFTSGSYPYVQHIKILSLNETGIRMAMNMVAPDISFIDQTLIFEVEIVEVYKTSDIES